jgi:hypothetical protein
MYTFSVMLKMPLPSLTFHYPTGALSWVIQARANMRTQVRVTGWNLKVRAIAALACFAAGAALPCQAQPLGQAERRAIVEKAGELLTANYVFPDRALEAKARIDAALKAGEYESLATPGAFAERLTRDLQAVTRDGHLGVASPPVPRPSPGGPPARAAAAPAPQRVYAGFSRVDRLKGNIGYIRMENFPPVAGPFSQTVVQAMTDLAGTDALILDMRGNGGGNFDSAFYLCSFFFDSVTPVHLDSHIARKSGTNEFSTKEFHTQKVPVSYLGKPVYLLAGKRTVSAGETFLYALQAQKRARLIGETTPGSANGSANLPLPHRFMMSIPVQTAVNPVTKANFEGLGVKPDLAVEESLAFQTAMREIAASNPGKYAGLKNEIESQSGVDAFTEARLLKFRDQPQPGGADAARALFAGIASGKPDYGRMSDEVAQMVKDDFDFFHADMRRLGEARSVRFTGVRPTGLDNYEIVTATFVQPIAVYLGPDGKIVAAGFYPPRPLSPRP